MKITFNLTASDLQRIRNDLGITSYDDIYKSIINTYGKMLDKIEGFSENDFFGIVRWCNDDIAAKLEDMGIEASKENIAIVRKNCENNRFFCDTMVLAGWDMIEDAIRKEFFT